MKADTRNDESLQPGKDEADRGEDQVILMGETTTSRVNIYCDLKVPAPQVLGQTTVRRQSVKYANDVRGAQPR
jgi:hypothetical protein